MPWLFYVLRAPAHACSCTQASYVPLHMHDTPRTCLPRMSISLSGTLSRQSEGWHLAVWGVSAFPGPDGCTVCIFLVVHCSLQYTYGNDVSKKCSNSEAGSGPQAGRCCPSDTPS